MVGWTALSATSATIVNLARIHLNLLSQSAQQQQVGPLCLGVDLRSSSFLRDRSSNQEASSLKLAKPARSSMIRRTEQLACHASKGKRRSLDQRTAFHVQRASLAKPVELCASSVHRVGTRRKKIYRPADVRSAHKDGTNLVKEAQPA